MREPFVLLDPAKIARSRAVWLDAWRRLQGRA